MNIHVGQKVHLDEHRSGVVKYIGCTQFSRRKEEWVGLELDQPMVRKLQKFRMQ